MTATSAKIERMVIGCLSNDPGILEANLLASPVVKAGRLPVLVEKNPESAAKGYNRILSKAASDGKDLAILAHHDIYLPPGWEECLAARISEVEEVDPNWGVIAAYGIDKNGGHWGPVWSTSIGKIVGRVPMEPVSIESADELLLVVRCADGLVFDEDLPHFHFYGLDIVQTARAAGMGAWSVALPLVHNDGFKSDHDKNYDLCFHYVRRKWYAALPLVAPTVKVDWHGLHLLKSKWRLRKGHSKRQQVIAAAQADPRTIAERCGWNKQSVQ